MNPLLRTVLAVISGVVISSLVIGSIDALNAYLYPSPILVPTIQEQAELIKNSPLNEFLLVLFGFILSSFFGGYTAARIAPKKKKMVCAMFVGFFWLLCGIVYFIIIPQPIWYSVSSGISYLLFAWLGAKAAMYESW